MNQDKLINYDYPEFVDNACTVKNKRSRLNLAVLGLNGEAGEVSEIIETPDSFFIPSLSDTPVRNTAAWSCMAHCISSRSAAVAVPPSA